MALTPGPVTSDHFPYIPLVVTIASFTWTVEALLDTGFDGYLVIPSHLLAAGAPPDTTLTWMLADGSYVTSPSYLGQVRIGAFPPLDCLISVLGDEPIVGRSITDNYQVVLEYGQRVIVHL